MSGECSRQRRGLVTVERERNPKARQIGEALLRRQNLQVVGDGHSCQYGDGLESWSFASFESSRRALSTRSPRENVAAVRFPRAKPRAQCVVTVPIEGTGLTLPRKLRLGERWRHTWREADPR